MIKDVLIKIKNLLGYLPRSCREEFHIPEESSHVCLETISKSALPEGKASICWKGSGRVIYTLATLILNIILKGDIDMFYYKAGPGIHLSYTEK